MSQLPDFLIPYRKQAEGILAAGLVRDIEFSGETYQVQVIDPETKKAVWTFLQFDSRGHLKDCFCSCEEETEEQRYCAHLAAAYLRIYNGSPLPLHQRFKESLWNRLCHLYSDVIGDDPDRMKKKDRGYYRHKSKSGDLLVSIKAKTSEAKQLLKKIIDERKKETETTSLKFSNLSEEDIALWEAGTPSSELRYELSFWNDLAHWLMFLQDTKMPYTIEFEENKERVPNRILISFPDIELSFHLTEDELTSIIPALATVKSPLSVHEATEKDIESISYDKIKDRLLIQAAEISKSTLNEKPKEGKWKQLDGWIYIPEDGFYASGPHELAKSPEISSERIPAILSRYTSLLQKRLKDTALHTQPLDLKYTLKFDKEWNLHIVAYASAPGDLNAPNSHYYGDWAYLDNAGFYPIAKARFDQLETIIPSEEVGDFVYAERDWLNVQEGFQTHLTSIETLLTYTLTKDNQLSFAKLLSIKKPGSEIKDFGVWVYVAGQGFYAKGTAYTTLPVSTETTIHAHHIPFFIRVNQAELQLVPGFFSKVNPIVKAGVRIELNRKHGIDITPEYQLLPKYQKKDVRFFEEYVYVADEGFHELPASMRLPEQFRHPFHVEPKNVPLFLNYELDDVLPFTSEIDQRLLKPSSLSLIAYNIERVENAKEELFSLELCYKTGHGVIPIPAIWSAIKQKKKFLFHEAGCIDLTEKRFDWLKRIPKEQVDKAKHTVLLSTLELIRLHAMEEIVIDKNSPNAVASAALLKELTEFQLPEEPDLTGMLGTLRPYQKIGVHWLWFLYRHNLSGLLCDEMGLGKTHQAMALLTGVINAHRSENWRQSPHFLVVCPTSVMFHWKEKLQAFFPELRICTFYGSDRSIEEFHQQYDLLLTSYGIWRLEHELLSKISFEVAIFDEIQIAKNQNSRIHATLQTVNAKMRLGLTGTPIENYLRELKALFDLVLPGYMPNDTDYRELFVRPIERDESKPRRNLLRRFTSPFMLRRKKLDVLPDLPDKTEEIAHCELSSDQQTLYTQVLHQSRTHLLEQLQDPSAPVPYMHIFALLANLKQICDHPAVYLKQPELYRDFSSGKWELFVELLSEARESQQKVVIFSQYLFMLDILEAYLTENEIQFATIRGATMNRGEQVNRFNQDPQCEVFLGSLQAAGLGVDLTGGSVVIHYDRWWNAARENQATDRVHRIGQTRGVQVFKLVTKGTFEERIDEIISRKARLMEDIVAVDDHRFMKAFDREELIQLLQDIEETKEQ